MDAKRYKILHGNGTACCRLEGGVIIRFLTARLHGDR